MATKYTWSADEQNNQKVIVSSPRHFFIRQSSKGTRLFQYDAKADGGYVACGSYNGLREAKLRAEELHEEIANSWEGMLVVAEASFNTHLKDYEIPAANYKFVPGQDVRYGNRPGAKVEWVSEDGRKVLISVDDKGESYGRPYDNHRRLPIYIWWTEIDPVEGVEETNFRKPRIHTQYTQTSLDSLVHQAYHRGIIDSPDYQRDYVWTLEDKQRLIKSIFDRADIGKFLLMEYPHPEYRLEVVDGKQRLNAIRDFKEGRFAYEGKTWFQLSTGDKQAFFDVMVQVCYLQRDMIKKSDVLWLFLSVNAAGVPQTEEHIAHAKALYEQALKEESKS